MTKLRQEGKCKKMQLQLNEAEHEIRNVAGIERGGSDSAHKYNPKSEPKFRLTANHFKKIARKRHSINKVEASIPISVLPLIL